MEEECFNCSRGATERYTLVLESSTVLEDVVICEACVPEFRTKDWIEVHDDPVLTRGGDDRHDEEEST